MVLSDTDCFCLSYNINNWGGRQCKAYNAYSCALIAISTSENELVCGIFGAVSGLFTDIGSGKLTGFNAVIFLLIGVVASLLFLHYIRRSVINVVAITFAAAIIQGLLNFFFFYALIGYESYHIVFIKFTMPSVLFTTISAIIIYFVIKAVLIRFEEPDGLIVGRTYKKGKKERL